MLPVYQTFSSQLLETQAGGLPHYSYATHNILFLKRFIPTTVK